MRLIHTADWHLGRRLKGIDRTPEIEGALYELLQQAKKLEIDAILIAGDIFDSPSPTADAEQIAYNFFSKLREAKIPAVAIAGNHDSAFRIDGVAKLLSHIGIYALGRPRKSSDGGTINLETASGSLCVAAVPFASERRLLKAEDLWEKDDLEQRQHYRATVNKLLRNLAASFDDNSVNVLMAHLTLEGSRRAYSEVDYYTRDTYILSGQILPPEAQYIALGHIHKPQHISNAAPTYYSGSLIQVDFGEAEEQKGFNLITVEPGSPAAIEFIPIKCEKPLKVLRCDETNLEETLEANRQHPGFLKVIVELTAPKIGLADLVRKICPQALQIQPVYPEAGQKTRANPQDASQFNPLEEFRRYYLERLGTAPSESVIETFQQLHKEALGNW